MASLLSARDALTYISSAPIELRNRLHRLARDPANTVKRERLLTQIEATELWLAVLRRAVTDGRLGEWQDCNWGLPPATDECP